MIHYDERVGCVAVYEAHKKQNCLSGIDRSPHCKYYGHGYTAEKNGVMQWHIPRRRILWAKFVYWWYARKGGR